MASQLALSQYTLLAVSRGYVDANHQDLHTLYIINITLDKLSISQYVIHVRSVGVTEADAKADIFPALSDTGKLFTRESGCRLGCISVHLK